MTMETLSECDFSSNLLGLVLLERMEKYARKWCLKFYKFVFEAM